MPDRSRPSSPPQDPDSQGPESRGAGARGTGKDDDNPFAPPPEGTPDRPWRPRRPSGDSSGDSSEGGSDGSGRNSPWGSQWSDRQPGRSQGGFGERPGRRDNPGQEDPAKSGNGGGTRWDPKDPAQRRARYALLSGMWAFFFALFGWRYVALLLGALALSWAIQSLRAKPRTPDPTAAAPERDAAVRQGAATATRPQTTAAISGLVTGALALLMVAATFTAQLVYRDYYTCVDDALTSTSQQACEDLLPEQLRPLLGERDD
ncbi:Integral membrane protein OS=Streptomyces alboniger OX=132473 GN=CP975_21525 PE=4 SV=1 [Streptomyces alboniger]